MMVGESWRLLDPCVMCWEVGAAMGFMVIVQDNWGFPLAASIENICRRITPNAHDSHWRSSSQETGLKTNNSTRGMGIGAQLVPLLDQRYRLNLQNQVINRECHRKRSR